MSPAQKPAKERLDKLLMDKGLCESRNQAQGLILAGQVTVNGQLADKPGQQYSVSVDVALKQQPKYVSRGGLKLEHALAVFAVEVTDAVCLDVGSSTGGFTDCLLQHGAWFVHSVDVGYGQLAWRLRQDPKVKVFEKTHILNLDVAELDPLPSIAVVDVSFISLKKVLPKVLACLTAQAAQKHMVCLVKPQFEYKDYCSAKGFKGVVTRSEDLETILNALAHDVALLLPEATLAGVTESPIQGPEGNREFFFHLRVDRDPSSQGAGLPVDFAETVKALVFKESLQNGEE